MHKVELSIIIPVWNGEKYIKKCVDSCIDLDIDAYEIIVINDGSTDDTLTVLARNYSGIDNLRVYTTENRGLSCARNFGVENAKGQYIMFLDADDWLEKNVNYLLKQIEENSLDVLLFAAQDVFEDDSIKAQDRYPVNGGSVVTGKDIIGLSNMVNIRHEAWRGIYSRSFLVQNNLLFLDGVLYEDNAFWFRVMRNAERIMYTNDVIYNYRIRPDSIVHSTTNRTKVWSVFKIIEDILLIEDINKEYLSTAIWKIMVLIQGCERSLKSESRESVIDDDLKNQILLSKHKIIRKVSEYVDKSIENLKQLYYFIGHITFCFGVYDDKLLEYTFALRDKNLKYIQQRMKEWPLGNSEYVVGIYGSGRDSDVLLDTYMRVVGEIKADYLYIDSNLRSYTAKHLNHPIVNIDDLHANHITSVIIGSKKYGKDMEKRVRSSYSSMNIYSLYDSSTSVSVEGLFNLSFIELYLELKNTEANKRIILIGTPEYPNVGDHLICSAEKKFFSEYFSEYTIVEITSIDYWIYKSRIKDLIKEDDILVITGGGFLGSLWTEGHYDEVLDVVTGYKKNHIVIMPQSVYFENNLKGRMYREITKSAFNRDKILIFCREKFSYNVMKEIVPMKNTVEEAPDIAFYYKSSLDMLRGNNVGIFLRNDKESIISDKEKEMLIKYIEQKDNSIRLSSMQYGAEIMRLMRDGAIEEKLEEIAQYKYVITDQLHCMISCAIVGTPCIAFNNVSKKLEGVYNWIKKQHNNILLANSVKDIYNINFNELKSTSDRDNVIVDYEWKLLAERIRGLIKTS